MRNLLRRAVLTLLLGNVVFGLLPPAFGQWPGVDEAVIHRFAEQAGRPPREPYVNFAQGDMALFVFLVAGAMGGFVAGYYFRVLFPPRGKETGD